MKRNKHRESALRAILTKFRDTCQRVYAERDTLGTQERVRRYADATEETTDRIYQVMRPDWKPDTPAGA